jgi:hypothetical protein
MITIDKIFYFFAAVTCLMSGVFIVLCLWFWNKVWFQITWEQAKQAVIEGIDRAFYWVMDKALGKE